MKIFSNTSIYWGRSLFLGLLATVGLGVCSPLWMLAQMGGPIPFTSFWLLITSPFFLLMLFLSKARDVLAGFVCGLLFSSPVAVFCWLFSTIDPNVEKYYRTEIRRDGVATLLISVIVMLFVVFLRHGGQAERRNK